MEANVSRVIKDHYRTQLQLQITRNRIKTTISEHEETRAQCHKVVSDYEQAVLVIDKRTQASIVRESERLQEQEYINGKNAGKPIGFFALPSMLTRNNVTENPNSLQSQYDQKQTIKIAQKTYFPVIR